MRPESHDFGPLRKMPLILPLYHACPHAAYGPGAGLGLGVEREDWFIRFESGIKLPLSTRLKRTDIQKRSDGFFHRPGIDPLRSGLLGEPIGHVRAIEGQPHICGKR